MALISGMALALMIAGGINAAAGEEGAGDVFDGQEQAAIEQIIADYLVENPELIVRALRVLEQREVLAAAERQRATLIAARGALENNPAAPVGGAWDGDVTVVEFFDYRCPHCKTVAPSVAGLITDDAKVRVIYLDLPILGPVSVFAARASLAAHAQGRFQEFHDAVMGQRQVTEKSVMAVAQSLGLDLDQLARDMASTEVENQLRDNIALAQGLGINGTPAFIIGDQVVPGVASLDKLKQLVDVARQ